MSDISAAATDSGIQFAALLTGVWKDLQDPGIIWQIVVVLGCLAVGWAVARQAKRRHRKTEEATEHLRRIGGQSLLQIVFPAVSLLLLISAGSILVHYQRTALIDLAIPIMAALALIRFIFVLVRQISGDSQWSHWARKGFGYLVWIAVSLHILGWLPEVISALDAVSVTLSGQKLSLWMVLKGLAMVILAMLVALWISHLLERKLDGATTIDPSVRAVVARVSRVTLVFLAVLIALPMVGINLTTLSIFGGALGVGLGFGMQKIASNYVSGFILLFDRSIRIGSMISVGSERGTVREITTRYTVIRAPNGIESLIPNETLIGSVVQNETFSNSEVAIGLDFQVGYDSDLEKAMRILTEAAAKQARVLTIPAPAAYLLSFGDSAINLRLSCWIADPRAGTNGTISGINMDVWKRFQEEGISIPFPQSEVRLLPGSELATHGTAEGT